MPAPNPSPARPLPRWTKAAWWALLGGLSLTFVAYQLGVAFRRPGEWLPGVGQALVGIVVTAISSFACGLVALLRRERRCWLALPPFLAGLCALLYFAWNLATR